MLVLIISGPSLGRRETYEIKEARSILILLDTSSSMLQSGLLGRVKGLLTNFIYNRPKEDRLAVARFDSDASGGIFTRNHQGLILEISRPTVVQELDTHYRDRLVLREKGTQIGIGLFKALTSFLEDEVETRMAEKQLELTEQDKIYRELQDILRRFLWHFRQKNKTSFSLQIPLIPNLEEVGAGKALIVLTDGELLDATSPAERVNYMELLGYYQQLGFRHLYFICLLTRPTQLDPVLARNPSWKLYTVGGSQAGLQEVFNQIAKEIDQISYGKSIISTRIKEQPLFPFFLPGLLLLFITVGLQLYKGFRWVP